MLVFTKCSFTIRPLQMIESGEFSLAYHGIFGCSIRFVSPTSTVRIHFTSDYSVRNMGFNGTYRSNFNLLLKF